VIVRKLQRDMQMGRATGSQPEPVEPVDSMVRD
jgi:hypothetical protein